MRRIRGLLTSLYSVIFYLHVERDDRERKARGMRKHREHSLSVLLSRQYGGSDLFRGKFEISVEPLPFIGKWQVFNKTRCSIIT